MKKLVLQMQMTIDGFVAGPNGELDWMSQEMDPRHLSVLQQLTESMDTILMGRKMAGGFTGYWESVVDNQPDSPEYPYAKIFVDTPKIVFSKTTQDVPGRNVTIENGDLVETVKQLKNASGKDIIVYGGAGFVKELVSNKLIDELNLFINPTAIGEGLTIFVGRSTFKLADSQHFDSGVVYNKYLLV